MIVKVGGREIYFKSEFDDLYASFRSQKFVESKNPGYDAFYLIPGGKDLSVENDELIITGNVTKGKLKNAFTKMAKKKQSNRVLVNRFITGIA